MTRVYEAFLGTLNRRIASVANSPELLSNGTTWQHHLYLDRDCLTIKMHA